MSKGKDGMTEERWKRLKEKKKGTNRYSWVSKYGGKGRGKTKVNKKPAEKLKENKVL